MENAPHPRAQTGAQVSAEGALDIRGQTASLRATRRPFMRTTSAVGWITDNVSAAIGAPYHSDSVGGLDELEGAGAASTTKHAWPSSEASGRCPGRPSDIDNDAEQPRARQALASDIPAQCARTPGRSATGSNASARPSVHAGRRLQARNTRK
ncbi:hypothetical protein EVG20_g1281 [Dentipellis fragilis]|uniref:Uncharacterized protein n=1 Tax=Dentipellis fragilis TaxID=205917 RepID=A0A4Y9ZA39_9AGAM|nr:hypothetical protein EVG20_g1281 [Dentipellis fragilis]